MCVYIYIYIYIYIYQEKESFEQYIGDDFLGLRDQKSSQKHVSDFEW